MLKVEDMQVRVRPFFLDRVIAQGKNIQSDKNNTTLRRNDISFCSQDVSQALRMQALRSANNSMITDSRTNLGANYNKETNSIDFKLASQNADDVVDILVVDQKPGKLSLFKLFGYILFWHI